MGAAPPNVGEGADFTLGSVFTDVAGQIVQTVFPWLRAILFFADILELAGVIPDPIALLLGLFAGRPREEATVQQGQCLLSTRNPAARLWGIELLRMVKEWGIVTSTSDPGQRAILDKAFHQFVTNMQAQGVSLQRAREIGIWAMSREAQLCQATPPELNQPLPSGQVFNGPSDAYNMLQSQYQLGIGRGLSINDALQKAEGYMYKHLGIARLIILQVGQPIIPQPPPQQIIPGQNGVCPTGYTLNSTTEMCVLNPPPGGGGGGGGGGDGGGPPPGGQPDPDGDEITDDLCAQMQANTAALISAIQGISSGQQPPDPTCCQNIVSAIGDVVSSLSDVVLAIGKINTGGGVDLSGVVDALNELVKAVSDLTPSGGVDLSGVVEQLTRIADYLKPGPATDLKAIADALDKANQLHDVPHGLVQQFFSDKVMPQEYSAILQGTPMDWVHAALIAAARVSPIIGFVEHVLGDDADFTAALRANREAAKASVAALMKLGKDIPNLPPEASTDTIKTLFKKYLSTSEAALTPLIKDLLDPIIEKLTGTHTPAVGVYPVKPDSPIADSTAITFGGAVAGWLAAYAGIDEGEPIAKIVEFMGAVFGFEELRDVEIGPLIREGIGRVATMQARKQFQQNIPGNGEIMGWVARGLLEQARADELEALNGLHFSLRGPAQQAAYQGLNPRMLMRLSRSGLFTQGDLVDEMNFAGMRPASQKRLLSALAWLGTESERNQLRSTLEKAYIQGLLGDADFHQQLDQLDHTTDRDALVMARVQLEKRITFAKGLENAYRQEFVTNAIVEDQYRSMLAGIGLQPDWINWRLGEDEAHKTSILARQAAAAERALERETAAEERRAAMANFKAGHIDAAALSVALVLTGLSPVQAAAWVDLAVLQKAGGLRWIYGLQQSPAEAALLRARVTALSDQRKRQQITDPDFVVSLQALGIPPHYVNSIRASVDAMITPKTSAVRIPVETQ